MISKIEKPKRQQKLKFDTRMVCSYPIELYNEIRFFSQKKGVSAQDFQRRAVEFYVEHLRFDGLQFQNQFKKKE